jgi:hypothetical protein
MDALRNAGGGSGAASPYPEGPAAWPRAADPHAPYGTGDGSDQAGGSDRSD